MCESTIFFCDLFDDDFPAVHDVETLDRIHHTAPLQVIELTGSLLLSGLGSVDTCTDAIEQTPTLASLVGIFRSGRHVQLGGVVAVEGILRNSHRCRHVGRNGGNLVLLLIEGIATEFFQCNGQRDGFQIIAVIGRTIAYTYVTLWDNEVFQTFHTLEGPVTDVLHTAPVCELIKAIQMVWKGKNYLSREVQDIVSQAEPDAVVLSNVERNILRLICDGHTNPEIASHLNLSIETVNWYRKRLLAKYGVKNTVNLVTLAMKEQLV